MQCPKCSSLNPDEAFFCGECGAQMRSTVSPAAGPIDLGRIQVPAEPAAAPEAASSPPGYSASGLGDLPGVPATPHLDAALAGANPLPSPPPPAPYLSAAPAVVPPPPPPAGMVQGYPPPMEAYGVQAPYAGNTSGMGAQYPAPPQAQGWSFAGFVPYGIFAFANGITLWGILWWVLAIFGLSLVHDIYIGIKGRELAWQNRRFDSIEQFDATMRVWNFWGIALLAITAGFLMLLMLFFGVAMLAAMSELQ